MGAVLPLVAAVDELWSGVAVAGAPSVEGELGLSHRAYVVFVFAGPIVAASAIEAAIALASDRIGRRKLVMAGQLALAASLLFTSWTRSPWGLTVGLALAGASSGVACASAQGVLVREGAREAERAMVRWTLFASVGDVLAPLVTAASVALAGSYRGALVAIAAVVLAQAGLAARASKAAGSEDDAEAGDDEPPAEPLRVALGRAWRRPRLWAWLFAAASCTLLDELVVALGALRLARDEGATAAMATAAGALFSLGAVVGAVATERASRWPARRVLVASSVACAIAIGCLLATVSPIASCAALFVVGVTCSPHHPLTQARAYAELPGRPGAVQALGQLFVVIDMGAPIVLGVVADRYGVGAAIGCLVVQPIVVGLCAAVLGREPSLRSG